MESKKAQAIECLQKQGFRITKQREILIDIILSENCSCCKEVYVLASRKDPGIGMATVYRTVDALERVGALEKGMAYRLCGEDRKKCQSCLIELEDGATLTLNYPLLEKMIEQGIQDRGLSKGQMIKEIMLL
ncbi:MAG: transcriptional repressor [Fusicatenibacter sp.]|nr:transcriptional repressor [Lachnospiraceae bacterium]MDY2937956.1 transcriptional repressor [Fusicatenibacter sp.]